MKLTFLIVNRMNPTDTLLKLTDDTIELTETLMRLTDDSMIMTVTIKMNTENYCLLKAENK